MSDDSKFIQAMEEQFRIRVRPARSSRSSGGDDLDAKLRQWGASGRPGHRDAHASGGSVGSEFRGFREFRGQRVVIKSSYTVHRRDLGGRSLREHVQYLVRESASQDGQPGRFYNDCEVDLDAAEFVRSGRVRKEWKRSRESQANHE